MSAKAPFDTPGGLNVTRPPPLLADIPFLQNSAVAQLVNRYMHQYEDFALALGIAIVLPLLRGTLDYVVFKPLGRLVICGWKAPNKEQQALIYKWKESCWKALVYLSMALLAFRASYQESWFTQSRALWEGCTQLPCNYQVPTAVRLVYVVEMGFYMQAIPSLVIWEVRRKDFLESLSHHFATLLLIVYSYYLNLTKVGAMVFLCHDVNDIFMEMAKMGRYMGLELLPNLLFVCFLLSWIVSRLYVFPNWVIRSTLYDTLDVAREHNVNVHPHYEIFNGFLIFLLVLHIYWTWLIVKVLYKIVKSGTVDDVREEGEDGKED